MLDDLYQLFSGFRFSWADESDLQDAIEQILVSADIPYSREHVLGPGERPDFLVGDVAIEVKVKGSADALLRQVKRYADHDEVGSVLVVTSKPKHGGVAGVINGRQVDVLIVRPMI